MWLHHGVQYRTGMQALITKLINQQSTKLRHETQQNEFLDLADSMTKLLFFLQLQCMSSIRSIWTDLVNVNHAGTVHV